MKVPIMPHLKMGLLVAIFQFIICVFIYPPKSFATMGQEFSKKAEELNSWYQKRRLEIGAKNQSTEKSTTELNSLAIEYKEKMAVLVSQVKAASVPTPVAKSSASEPAPAAKGGGTVKSFVVSEKGQLTMATYRTSDFSETDLQTLYENPFHQSFDRWALAAEKLFKSGQRRQALFCWYVFSVLGMAQVAFDETVIGYMYGMRSRFGNSIIQWVSPDLDLWEETFAKAMKFTASGDWKNNFPNAELSLWKEKIKTESKSQQENLSNKLFSASARAEVVKSRTQKQLPLHKLKDGLGEGLPKAWQ